MSLDFFENSISAGINQMPNELYRDLNQAFIDEQWENTTTRYTVQEQVIKDGAFVKDCFDCIEVWKNYVVGQGTSMRNGQDFIQLGFRDIDHFTVRGRYYKFEENYWITTFNDEHDGLFKTIVVRRCNNVLRIVDPENGAVFSVPCVVDYDMSSPSNQVSRYILTPNNHAVVMVQGNVDTVRLFKTNVRFILAGRPFKLYAYQNAIYDDYATADSTLLYLDMYLDEIHDGDDLAKGLADNGLYDYRVSINGEDMALVEGAKGQLAADVKLNGVEVDRDVVWSSSNPRTVAIDEFGKYRVIGDVGDDTTIVAQLSGNKDVTDSIIITVAAQEDVKAKVYIDPAFDKIREYQTISFNVYASYGGVEYTPNQVELSLSKDMNVMSNEYLDIEQTTSGWKVRCSQRSQIPQTIYITVSNQIPAFEASEELVVQATSMMG
nr:MAG TPA: hypothetical protein [Caudoviricetes sp.]